MRFSLPPLRTVALALLAAALLPACDSSGTGASIWNPEAPSGAAPVIASVSPSGVVLAGIDEITIAGQNFSATPADNLVSFDDGTGNAAQGTVLEASPTSLRVRVPNLVNPALRLRVAVRGAPEFSNAVALPLSSATVTFGNLDVGSGESVFSLASTRTTLYASMGLASDPRGIAAFTHTGTRSVFSTSPSVWSDLTVSSAGELFGARRVRAVFRLTPTGDVTHVTVPVGHILSSVVAGADGVLWAGGSIVPASNGALFRIAADRTFRSYPFTETVRDLAVGPSTLFVASETAAAAYVVWRFPIEASGDLGPGAVYYNVTAAQGAGVRVNALALAADGTLFVGTSAAVDPIVAVSPDGVPSVVYPGVLRGPATAFAWAPGTQLYVAQDQVAATTTTPAVPFRLYVLETRRAGPF